MEIIPLCGWSHTGQIGPYTDIFDEESHEYDAKHLVDYQWSTYTPYMNHLIHLP